MTGIEVTDTQSLVYPVNFRAGVANKALGHAFSDAGSGQLGHHRHPATVEAVVWTVHGVEEPSPLLGCILG